MRRCSAYVVLGIIACQGRRSCVYRGDIKNKNPDVSNSRSSDMGRMLWHHFNHCVIRLVLSRIHQQEASSLFLCLLILTLKSQTGSSRRRQGWGWSQFSPRLCSDQPGVKIPCKIMEIHYNQEQLHGRVDLRWYLCNGSVILRRQRTVRCLCWDQRFVLRKQASGHAKLVAKQKPSRKAAREHTVNTINYSRLSHRLFSCRSAVFENYSCKDTNFWISLYFLPFSLKFFQIILAEGCSIRDQAWGTGEVSRYLCFYLQVEGGVLLAPELRKGTLSGCDPSGTRHNLSAVLEAG